MLEGEVVHTLKITEVEPNKNQPRKQFDEEVLGTYCVLGSMSDVGSESVKRPAMQGSGECHSH